MSTRDLGRRAGVLALALGAAVTGLAQQAKPAPPQGPGLGVPARPAEVARMDVSIPPDGSGLPPGSGTPAKGAEVYAAKCLPCHGVDGAGTPNDRLVGGEGTIASATPLRTTGSYWPYATTIFDYVRRAMPYPTPHALTDAEAYAVTAYLLHLNGIIGKDAVVDAKTLPQIRMPNRDNFESAYPGGKP
jgi:S-disulfanyl-L-cysteine oxidoreductase SoxD